MKYRKWVWLVLGIASIAICVWRFATPYEMKVSDPLSKVAIDIGLNLLVGLFGFFCLFMFMKVVKANKKRQNLIDDFGKDQNISN
jgi:hypothetical protein